MAGIGTVGSESDQKSAVDVAEVFGGLSAQDSSSPRLATTGAVGEAWMRFSTNCETACVFRALFMEL